MKLMPMIETWLIDELMQEIAKGVHNMETLRLNAIEWLFDETGIVASGSDLNQPTKIVRSSLA